MWLILMNAVACRGDSVLTFSDMLKIQPTLQTVYYASNYVGLLFDYVAAQGLNAEDVLGEPRPSGGNSLQVFTGAQWQCLLQRAAVALDDPLLGLHVGQTIEPATLGALGYVFTACQHLGAALLRWQQYERLISNVETSVLTLSPVAVEIVFVNAPRDLGPLIDEAALTAIVEFSRRLIGQCAAVSEVCFVNPAPKDISAYEAYFGGVVRFAQPVTSLRIDFGLLQQPVLQPDATLLAMMEHQVSTLLASMPAMDHLERGVREAVANLARSGEVSIEQVAEQMHITSRTLHRRLARMGLKFSQLRDDTLVHLAKVHLRDRRLSLNEVAWLLGYSEHSAFTRAFSRWTGMPPQRWRDSSGEALT